MEMGEYNEQTQRDEVAAGYKGGPLFSNPVKVPTRNIVDQPKEVDEKFMASGLTQPTPSDPWVIRYPNAKMK